MAAAADIAVIITARDEAPRLAHTLRAVARAFPGARVIVADDGSRDGTDAVARSHGAEVLRSERSRGKGAAATGAARRALAGPDPPAVAVLCDGDLGDSAERLGALVDALRADRGDVAVAAFSRRVGGGFGLAVGFARWVIRRRSGVTLGAPISGQRAVSAADLATLLPFAPRFGMEVGMTIDALRRGLRVVEVELDLDHRATRRDAAGFLHRGRQLADFALVYVRRR